MNTSLPSIIITGASGFVGRYFLDFIKDQYTVFAIARRSAKEANIPEHPNIQWIQWDIAHSAQIQEVYKYIQLNGGADYLLHLAAFYDFSYSNDVAYQRTNIDGTKNIIELAKQLKIKRFVFASSLAACNFPGPGNTITEKTSPDADFAYAKTKKLGEEMLRTNSSILPAIVIRFAAVFSDFCEYPPLYKFLGTWLSKGYDSRILGGKGESAVPYIHIHDLARLILIVLQKSHLLPQFDIYAASPDGSTSHKELFEISTRNYFGVPVKPLFIPRMLAYPGIAARIIMGKLKLTPEPFERFWMLKYLDLKLDTDASYTRQVLSWEPLARLNLMRRLMFLLARMKSNPLEWQVKNEAALRHISVRTNLLIYEVLSRDKEKLVNIIAARVNSEGNTVDLSHYQHMDIQELNLILLTLYNVLASTILNGDRSLIINYMDDLARPRFAEGFTADEISAMLEIFSEIISNHLLHSTDYHFTKQVLYDHISIPIQLAQDEIAEKYDFHLGLAKEVIQKKSCSIKKRAG